MTDERSRPYGIACPGCQSTAWRVADTRKGRGYIRRRHRCQRCEHKWTSYQFVVSLQRVIRYLHKKRDHKGRYTIASASGYN